MVETKGHIHIAIPERGRVTGQDTVHESFAGVSDDIEQAVSVPEASLSFLTSDKRCSITACYHDEDFPLKGAELHLINETNVVFKTHLNDAGSAQIPHLEAVKMLSLKQDEKNQLACEIVKLGDRILSYPRNEAAILAGDFEDRVASNQSGMQHCFEESKVLAVKTIFPPIIVNLRRDAKPADLHARSYLSPEELAYFKKQGNATLFIHGYNVPYGELSPQIEYIRQIDHAHSAFPYQVRYANAKSTLLRNTSRILQQLEPSSPFEQSKLLVPNHELHADLHLTDDQWLNGIGAHNWCLHMEDNLNRASGKFDQTHYEHYTRLINVAWSGDVGILNYMDAVANAAEAGKRLYALIEQLHQQNIQINIIAHSLGGQVLMSLMQEMGRRAMMGLAEEEIIEHVFLWNAAVPCDAFSPALMHKHMLYRFPQAHRAAKKITVLSSLHDNILGPMPQHDKRIWAGFSDPNGGSLMTAICLALNLMDKLLLKDHLRSVYNMANLMGVSWDFMLENQNNRQAYYQDWMIYHGRSKSGRVFAATLEEQKSIFRREHELCFNLISLAVIAYKRRTIIPLDVMIKLITRKSMDNRYHPIRLAPKKLDFFEKIPYVDDLDGNELATIVMTILISENVEQAAAMGYSGYDLHDGFSRQLENEGKLHHLNQTSWLFNHSGMKMPNEDMMRYVYKDYIMDPKKGIKAFGG